MLGRKAIVERDHAAARRDGKARYERSVLLGGTGHVAAAVHVYDDAARARFERLGPPTSHAMVAC